MAMAFLTGCGAVGPTDPYVLPVGLAARGDGPYIVSLCYNSNTTSIDGIRKLVDQKCIQPELLSNGYDLDTCSLLLPVRALFRCAKISDDLANERPQMPLQHLR
jgi:hypothetical protein